jgi:hypothetical protein
VIFRRSIYALLRASVIVSLISVQPVRSQPIDIRESWSAHLDSSDGPKVGIIEEDSNHYGEIFISCGSGGKPVLLIRAGETVIRDAVANSSFIDIILSVGGQKTELFAESVSVDEMGPQFWMIDTRVGREFLNLLSKPGLMTMTIKARDVQNSKPEVLRLPEQNRSKAVSTFIKACLG